MDKGYDCDSVYEELQKRNLASAIIRKRNRKQKNYELYKWRSRVRMPYEGVFSKIPKITRYRTKLKVQFEALIQALVHNCKRIVAIQSKLQPT